MKYKFKPSHIVPAFLFCVCVIYGGSKPPCSTNTPPDDASSPTNAPMMLCAGSLRGRGLSQTSQVGQSDVASGGLGKTPLLGHRYATLLRSGGYAAPVMLSLPPSTSTLNLNLLSNWTARGAYCDWRRIDFPDAFQFPVGTNLIDGVTLFAYGEVRVKSKSRVEVEQRNLSTCSADQPEQESNHHSSTSTSNFDLSSTSTSRFDYSLPTRVSLEPNVSSVTHGLTLSNSYLFAWHNACVERCATNRVNASIELFRSGEVVTCFGNEVERVAPQPPEDWIGIGQDDDWVRGTFPDEADDILAMGYENWLAAWVGENEMNGRYQCAVTVADLPANGEPCYLVCGPYRVNVTAPGTYRFPLEVLTTYETRTYPTAIPLSFAYDDGYTGGEQSYHVLDGMNPPHRSTPRMMMLAAPMHIPYDYWKTLCPDIVVTPDHLPLETASGSHLRFWCNVRDFTLAAIEGAAWLTWYEISHSEVALDRVDQIGWYYACAHERDWLLTGDFVIDPPSHTNEENTVTNRTDAWIFSGETIHTEIVQTNRLVTHVTAVSGTNPTTSLSIRLAEGQSAYVAIYMATSEIHGTPPYDDTVSWSVTSNGGGSLSGSTSVFANSEGFENAEYLTHGLYGIDYSPIALGGRRFAPPAGDSLRLQITITASDAIDNKRETCVQIVIYPVDANGNIIGLPSWVNPN